MAKLISAIFKRWGRPKPDYCWKCKSDDYLVYDNGEWKCSRCHVVVD